MKVKNEGCVPWDDITLRSEGKSYRLKKIDQFNRINYLEDQSFWLSTLTCLVSKTGQVRLAGFFCLVVVIRWP